METISPRVDVEIDGFQDVEAVPSRDVGLVDPREAEHGAYTVQRPRGSRRPDTAARSYAAPLRKDLRCRFPASRFTPTS